MAIKMTPTIAPIISGLAGPSGEPADLRISNLYADVVSVSDGTLYLRAAVDIRTGFFFNTAGGQLGFGIATPDPSNVSIVLLDNTIGTTVDLQSVLGPLLASQFASLGSAFGGFALPSFFGITPTVIATGKAGSFMAVYLGL
jgi:hypothetical protein